MKSRSLLAGWAFALALAGTAFALGMFGTVTGRILDEETGKPLVGATVTLELEGNPNAKPLVITTDKRGQFLNDRVLFGSYKVTFASEGLNKQVGTIKLEKTNPGADLGDIKLKPLPPDRTSAYLKADELVKEGKLDEAEAIYKEIIGRNEEAKPEAKLKPTDLAKLEFNLGVVYEKRKDYANAETAYKKALELDPLLAQAYDGLGNVYQAQNRPDAAVQIFQQAAAAQPNNGKLNYDLGLFLWSKGKNAEAYEALTKAAALMPDNPEVQYHLGVTAIGLNKNDEALQFLEKYLTMNPTNKENIESAKALIPAIKQTASQTSPTKK